MKPSTRDKIKSKFHELKGNAKVNVGRMTNNPRLEAEGRGEKLGATIRGKIGQVKRVLGK